MATWLIVVISVYCGLSYGVALMMLAIDHPKFSIRLMLEIIFFPVVLIWLFGEEIIDFLKDKW